MKIIFNASPYAFHTPGGGEIQLLQYKKLLSEMGIEIELLNQWDPNFYSADIVHSFSCQPDLLHFCAFVKEIELPLIVFPNLWIKEETKHLYGFDEIRMQFCLADRIVVNSEMEADLLARTFNIPGEKFFPVYNGVEEIFFEHVDPSIFRKHFDIQGPFLLNVANLEPRKNQLKMAEVIKQFPDMKLLLIGHERDIEYARQCYALGGEQVRYCGPIPHDSVLLRSAYAACEAFVLPSKLETPGLAALEAMAAGAKVIVTYEGSTMEYFGEGAVYVDPDDSDDIAKGISKALLEEKTLFPSFYMRANFTWHHVIQDLVCLYKNIDFEGSKRTTRFIGFNKMEKDFAWTKEQLVFKIPRGTISFLWHSLKGTEVDIYTNGVLANTIFVGTEWQFFEWRNLEKNGKEVIEIRLEVKEAVKGWGGDPRVLGVAIRDIEWMSPK